MRPVLAVLLVSVGLTPAVWAQPTQGGALPGPLPLFPADNWWNLDVSGAPVDPNSAAFISFIGTTRQVHPDFGGEEEPGSVNIYGFPYLTVRATQPLRAVQFDYSGESDGVDHRTDQSFAFWPIPDEAITTPHWVEGGPPGNVNLRADADRHLLIVDVDNKYLYELYNVWHNGTGWEAGSGAFFDLKQNGRRPEGWTSADAAGLAILPGLVRYDEAFGPDEIRHAFRVTVRATNGYVYPASHRAGTNPSALPMGARLRLKATKDISGYTPEIQRIFRAMKTYGLIVADNGSDMYVTGAFDTRWDNDVLNPAFHSLRASDFDVVQLGYQGAGLIGTFTAEPVVVAPGQSTVLSWAARSGASLTLDGVPVSGHTGMTTVTPSAATATTTYTLQAVLIGHVPSVETRKVTVHLDDGTSSLAPPVVTAPANDRAFGVAGIGFGWTAVPGAHNYDLRVWRRAGGGQVFSGYLTGAATSALISLPDGIYTFGVRACPPGGSYGAYGLADFNVGLFSPSGIPVVTAPAPGATLASSTQSLAWAAVPLNPLLSTMTYEVVVTRPADSSTTLQINVPHPDTSTVFTFPGGAYQMRVRGCQAGCGLFSAPVGFTVTLPPQPTAAPVITQAAVSDGTSD